MKHLLLTTIAAVLLVGCAMTGPIPPIQHPSASDHETIGDSLRDQINKEIDSMVKEWEEAAANKDAKTLSNLYAENADIIHYDNIHYVGRELIKQHFENQFINDPSLKKNSVSFSELFLLPKS